MSDPTSNYPAAVDFLQRFRLGGPWVLVAIAVDQKNITTKTFRDPAAVLAWLDQHGDRNVYFHVNPTIGDLDRKAGREDVAELAWLHIDIDPRGPAGDLDREQALTCARLSAPRGAVPPPTAIVFSGGGYQGFWKLASPIPINGSVDAAEDAKLWNLQLELIFGADQCHNVDRIMRLPGTVNWPTRKKAAKGRRPALATLVEFHEDRIYDLSRFTKAAPKVQLPAAPGILASDAAAPAPGNVRRLTSLDELDQWQVPERVKVLIVQGCNPDDPTKHESRSEALFACVCGLVRAGVPDDVIYAVITDKDFGISGSVLDKGSGVERYAQRQIARAHEEAVDPALREMNERHAVISNLGGKCVVMEQRADPENRGRAVLSFQSFAALRERYLNRKVKVADDPKRGPKYDKQGNWWLEHPQRRQYDYLVFLPGAEAPGAFNLWQGFACDALPGDCGLYLAHLRENVCSGNEEHYEWLLSWMAYAVQHPAEQGHVAVVLRGAQGAGKGTAVDAFGSLWGRHFLHVSSHKHLVGEFNAHLRDCSVLFADEAFWAPDRKHEAVLKTLVTEDRLIIEGKGVDVEQARNRLHILLASNSEWVVPAGTDERRYFVLEVAATHAQETAYFKAIRSQLAIGGREALLHLLTTRSLEGFEIRTPPKTDALREQKEATLRRTKPVMAFLLDVLRAAAFPWPFRGAGNAFRRIFHQRGEAYFATYPEMAQLVAEIVRSPVTAEDVRVTFERSGFASARSRSGGEEDHAGGRSRRIGLWVEPARLAEYRAAWDAESGVKQKWNDAIALEVPEEGKGTDHVASY